MQNTNRASSVLCWIALLVAFTINAVARTAEPQTTSSSHVSVAVAANMQFAMEELRTEFQKQSGIQVEMSVGSSGQLTAQIQNGAPFDVFLSADMEYPAKLAAGKFALGAPKAYAYGTLVLWTVKGFDLSKGLTALLAPEIARIAIANPDHAPYGREAVRAMSYYKIYDQLKEKLVYGESIAQTNNFILSGAADAGFTAKSVVLAPEMKGKGAFIEVDPKAYQKIAQGIVILKHGEETNVKASHQFYDFIFTEPARKILMKYGYVVE